MYAKCTICTILFNFFSKCNLLMILQREDQCRRYQNFMRVLEEIKYSAILKRIKCELLYREQQFILVNNKEQEVICDIDLTYSPLYFCVYAFPCLSRTFCFPGASFPATVHTAHNHTHPPQWTQGDLSYPLSDIYHSTVLLQLAPKTI